MLCIPGALIRVVPSVKVKYNSVYVIHDTRWHKEWKRSHAQCYCIHLCSLVPRPYKHFHCDCIKTLVKVLWDPVDNVNTIVWLYYKMYNTCTIVEVITDSLYKLKYYLLGVFFKVLTILSPEMQSFMLLWHIIIMPCALLLASHINHQQILWYSVAQ
jgi:hypothetical protein